MSITSPFFKFLTVSSLLFFVSVSAYSQTYAVTSIKLVKQPSSGNDIKYVGTGACQDVKGFELKSPPRYVVDCFILPTGGAKKNIAEYSMQPGSLVDSIRFGGHVDKVRVVIDLAPSAQGVTFQKNKDASFSIVIKGTGQPAKKEVAVVESAPTAEPTIGIEKPKVVASVSDTHLIPLDPVGPRKLGNIVFDYIQPLNTPVLRIVFSSPAEFRMGKSNDQEVTLTIPDCSLKDKSLSLPFFPPEDFNGFMAIEAYNDGKNCRVRISVDRGTRLSPYLKDREIQVRVPAG